MEFPAGLKRFIWLVTVVAISYFAADLTAAAIASHLQVPPRPVVASRTNAFPAGTALPASPRGLVQLLKIGAPKATPSSSESQGGSQSASQASQQASEITLKGTLAGNGLALAMIEAQGKTTLVGVGESIAGYTLLRVGRFSAEVQKNGKTRTLEMHLTRSGGLSSAIFLHHARRPVVPKKHGALSMEEFRNMIDHPERYAGSFKMSPVQRNGQVYGMRVQFTSNSQPLARLGLENNDIVTSVNGHPLKSPDDLARIYRILRNTPDLRIMVIRHGKSMAVYAHLTQ